MIGHLNRLQNASRQRTVLLSQTPLKRIWSQLSNITPLLLHSGSLRHSESLFSFPSPTAIYYWVAPKVASMKKSEKAAVKTFTCSQGNKRLFCVQFGMCSSLTLWNRYNAQDAVELHKVINICYNSLNAFIYFIVWKSHPLPLCIILPLPIKHNKSNF